MVQMDRRVTKDTRAPRANLVYREILDCKEALVKRLLLLDDHNQAYACFFRAYM